MQYTKNSVRERILNVGLEEFETKGFENTSMRDIVSKANSSLGNVYRYFKNKEDLYNAIVQPLIDDCLKNTDKFILDPKEFDMISIQMVSFFESNVRIFNILFLGSYNKYNDFIISFSNIFANKIKNYVDKKINNYTLVNNNIFHILANSFINGIKTIMENYTTKDEAISEIKELLQIMFLDIENKIYIK